MSQAGGIQNGVALLDGSGRETVVDNTRIKKPQPGMPMRFVVPGEELLGKATAVRQRTETFREPRPVFQSPEMAFRIRVVVGNMRSAVGLGDAQIRHQKSDRFRRHGGTPVRVDRVGTKAKRPTRTQVPSAAIQ
jgi:hypothetical protein